jgi:hypothetical protein
VLSASPTPPATRTRPSSRTVIVGSKRPVVMLAAFDHVLAAGS